ncbi:MAG TPA: hypothetical protein PK886_01185 [Candidatus Paceibacterota bacterium]|nr:hypothetical protein [Candidatus Paceibacterota bacterium]
MKNTYLIAILFLIIGLIGGQFLDLNINDQEGSVISTTDIKLDRDENLEPIENFTVIEIPDNQRQYACWSDAGGPLFISGEGSNSGTIVIGGITWSCYAITFNVS